MAGMTDGGQMLASLTVSQRPDLYAVVGPFPPDQIPLDAVAAYGEQPGLGAIVEEPEGWTVIAPVDFCRRRGWLVGPEFAWLTLDVHS